MLKRLLIVLSILALGLLLYSVFVENADRGSRNISPALPSSLTSTSNRPSLICPSGDMKVNVQSKCRRAPAVPTSVSSASWKLPSCSGCSDSRSGVMPDRILYTSSRCSSAANDKQSPLFAPSVEMTSSAR